ncbi:recombinase family protein, partial [Salmonella enterica]|uniref:recombinase family protein n=1 Tax=Salmonella enterica TaxID=28901 RepID=UPI003CC8BCE3
MQYGYARVSTFDQNLELQLEALRSSGCDRIFGHCCKVSDEAAFCLIQRPYISKTLLT